MLSAYLSFSLFRVCWLLSTKRNALVGISENSPLETGGLAKREISLEEEVELFVCEVHEEEKCF